MLVASVLGVILLLFLVISMHIPTKALLGRSPLPQLTSNILFGLSLFILTLWATYRFSLTIQKSVLVYAIILATLNFGSLWKLNYARESNKLQYNFNVRNFLVVVSASALSIFAQSGLSVYPSLRSRVGPDMIGWVSSGRYLFEYPNLVDLQTSIKNGLGITDLRQIFNEDQKILRHHVYNLLSFTDQANAEFLIGAKRVVAPRIFSFVMYLVGEYNLPLVVNVTSFVFIAIGLIFVIDNLGQINKITTHELLKILILILMSFNFAFQNPLNEGGLGQIFIFPSFALLILSYLRNIFLLESILVFLLSARLLYPEGGISTLFIVGVFLFFAKVHDKFKNSATFNRIYLFSLITTILFTLGLYVSESINLAKTVSNGAGGWNIGNLITPLNFGIINYVDTNGKSSPNQLWVSSILLISISMILLYFRKFNELTNVLKSREFKLMASLFFTWILLVYLSYSKNNNYSLWKFASFASVIIFVTFYHQITSHRNDKKEKDRKNKKIDKARVLTIGVILTISLWQSIEYQIKWSSGSENLRHLNLPKNQQIQIEKLLNTGAVVKFGEFSHQNTLALLGNLKWQDRGENIISPSNELKKLFVIKSLYCKPYREASEVLLLTDAFCFLDADSPSIELPKQNGK